MTSKSQTVVDWIEREVGKRFPDGETLPAGQLRVRVAILCFDLLEAAAGATNVVGEGTRLPTSRDQERLTAAKKALALGEPATEAEAFEQLEELHDAIRALQSTDDLGSEELNARAIRDMDDLIAKHEQLKKRLDKGARTRP
jgi:hypothetical protein